jgi:hypothetical protein
MSGLGHLAGDLYWQTRRPSAGTRKWLGTAGHVYIEGHMYSGNHEYMNTSNTACLIEIQEPAEYSVQADCIHNC